MQQVVIEIPDSTITDLKKKQNRTEVDNAILNGILLPKGHGRLIDENDLMAKMVDFCVVYDEIVETPTIVEEDTTESEGRND